jgi:CRP-like cAMP-binding protein
LSNAAIPPALKEQFEDDDWGAAQLQTINILKRFTKEELKLLYSKGEIRSFKPQTYIIIEGEDSRGLFIILKGVVSVYKSDATTGTMHRIAYLEEGKHFGELSLFDDSPRTATVSAENICYTYYLDFTDFDEFMKTQAQEAQTRFYRACSEELVERFKILNADYIASQQLLWRHALKKDSAVDAEPSPTITSSEKQVPQLIPHKNKGP